MMARAGFWAILGGAALAGLAQDPVNQGAADAAGIHQTGG
jgi:hypothetical protein